MPRARPVAGYNSMTEAVMHLTEEGLTDKAIAAAIGCPEKQVAALRASGRRRPPQQGRLVLLDHRAIEGLAPYARKRQIEASDLARRLLATIVKEGLVDAIMDDMEEA